MDKSLTMALAQAKKKVMRQDFREGNAIFGQWTWNGQGIAPLMRI